VRTQLGPDLPASVKLADNMEMKRSDDIAEARGRRDARIRTAQRTEVGHEEKIGVIAQSREAERLVDIYKQVQAGEMGSDEAKEAVGLLRTIQGSEYDAAIKQVTQGGGPSEQAIKTATAIASNLDINAKKVAADRTGMPAAGLRSGVEDIMLSGHTLEDAQAIAETNAEIASVTNDMNQDLKKTFGQNLVGWAEGDVSIAQVMGLSDEPTTGLTREQQKRRKKLLKSDEGKKIQALSAEVRAGQGALKKVNVDAFKITHGDAFRAAGLTAAGTEYYNTMSSAELEQLDFEDSIGGLDLSEKQQEELKTMAGDGASFKDVASKMRDFGLNAAENLPAMKRYKALEMAKEKRDKTKSGFEADAKEAAAAQTELAGIYKDVQGDPEKRAEAMERISEMKGLDSKARRKARKAIQAGPTDEDIKGAEDAAAALPEQLKQLEILAGKKADKLVDSRKKTREMGDKYKEMDPDEIRKAKADERAQKHEEKVAYKEVTKSLQGITGDGGEFMSAIQLKDMDKKTQKKYIEAAADMSGAEGGKFTAGRFKGDDLEAAQKVYDEMSGLSAAELQKRVDNNDASANRGLATAADTYKAQQREKAGGGKGGKGDRQEMYLTGELNIHADGKSATLTSGNALMQGSPLG
jgi:hypothetical protein